MAKFEVSVIIPVYNAESTLIRAVKSVTDNKHVKEIFLINDCSSDQSLDLCYDLKSQDPDLIHVIDNAKNMGAAASRNVGLFKASGSWIQFLDADDMILHHKLEDQKILVEKGDTDVLLGNYIQFKNNEKIYRTAENDFILGLILSNLGCTCSNLWRREKLIEVGGWDEHLSSSQEYNLMFKLFKHNARFSIDEDFTTMVYSTPNSITTSPERRAQNSLNRIHLRLRMLEYFKENSLLTIRNYSAIKFYIKKESRFIPESIPMKLMDTVAAKMFPLLYKYRGGD